MKSVVMIFDAIKGDFIKEAVYCNDPKTAMINAIMQYRGNYNTWEYPENIEGIYKSNVIKDRLLYNLTDNLIMYSQRA